MLEIYAEMEDSKEASEVNSFAFEQRNTEFLNKEISFFIENLRKVRVSFNDELLVESP